MIFVDSWAWIALADKDRGGQTSSSLRWIFLSELRDMLKSAGVLIADNHHARGIPPNTPNKAEYTE